MEWRNVMWVYCVEGTNRRWRWLIRAKPEGFPRWWSALYTSTWSMPWTPSSHTQHSHVHTQRDREWVSHTHKKINRFFFLLGSTKTSIQRLKNIYTKNFALVPITVLSVSDIAVTATIGSTVSAPWADSLYLLLLCYCRYTLAIYFAFFFVLFACYPSSFEMH